MVIKQGGFQPTAGRKSWILLPLLCCATPSSARGVVFGNETVDQLPNGACMIQDDSNGSNVAVMTPPSMDAPGDENPGPVFTLSGTRGTLTLMPGIDQSSYTDLTRTDQDGQPLMTYAKPSDAQKAIMRDIAAACGAIPAR